MTVSTDGILCYGWRIEEGTFFPWDEGPWDGDEDDWWMMETGFTPSVRPYTPEGEYVLGFSRDDPRVEAYFAERAAWTKLHPLPLCMVNCCSAEYPEWILAVPASVLKAHRGFPVRLGPSALASLNGPQPGGIEALRSFLAKYALEGEGPAWWLCSYWG